MYINMNNKYNLGSFIPEMEGWFNFWKSIIHTLIEKRGKIIWSVKCKKPFDEI